MEQLFCSFILNEVSNFCGSKKLDGWLREKVFCWDPAETSLLDIVLFSRPINHFLFLFVKVLARDSIHALIFLYFWWLSWVEMQCISLLDLNCFLSEWRTNWRPQIHANYHLMTSRTLFLEKTGKGITWWHDPAYIFGSFMVMHWRFG